MPNWFRDEEVAGLDRGFVSMLDYARQLAGVPFVITSGYRSPEHNAEIGGVPDSAHTKGLAVDIRVHNSSCRFLILRALLKVGFRRIELAPHHIHVDIDQDKPQGVIFFGSSN